MTDSPEAPAVRLYLFSGARKSGWKLLQRFGALRMALPKEPGIEFGRAMGCGRGIGFSFLPDTHRYAILVTGSDAALDAYAQGDAMTALGRESLSLETYDLLPLKGHGAWDGQQPFVPGGTPLPGAPMAVITRAKIPFRAIAGFIRHSNHVTASLAAAAGRLFSIGIGELPFVRQATFSVWTDTEAMMAFAYGSQRHRTAVTETRKRKLFGEEMFWRFAVVGYSKRPLQ